MEEKGYYSTFTLSHELEIDGVPQNNMIEGRKKTGIRLINAVIHGGSYSIPTKNVDFLTWKRNIETGKYWLKMHTMSGKEIRLQVNIDELNQIMKACGNEECEFGEPI